MNYPSAAARPCSASSAKFSCCAGTAVAMPPAQDAVKGMEDSNAKEALQAEPEAAGAYDKIPFANASAIFTMDTSNDIFLLHSIQVSN